MSIDGNLEGTGGVTSGRSSTQLSSSNHAGPSSHAGSAAFCLQRAGRYVLTVGPMELEVDPQIGGRITRFAFDGVDILAGPEFHECYFGSTLWLSPEAAWQSADPSSHDSGLYVVTSGQNRAGGGGSLPLVMETAAPSVIGDRSIHVAKSFGVSAADSAIVVTYSVQNAGKGSVQLAPWEVTRLPGGQMSFFPYGSTARATDGIRIEIVEGVAWFQHSIHADPEGQKLWADGNEGWTAHVSGDLLFVKKFPDLTLAQTANDETDVEIYSSNSANVPGAYIELEAQGPVVVLRPGESTLWTVRWYLMKIPPGVAVEVGSRSLVELVRGRFLAPTG